jgi:hypothetical protein
MEAKPSLRETAPLVRITAISVGRGGALRWGRRRTLLVREPVPNAENSGIQYLGRATIGVRDFWESYIVNLIDYNSLNIIEQLFNFIIF